MSSDDKDNRDKKAKPDPIEDVREGLGLLFRAAKSALGEIPTDKIEETLKTSVREVGKAVESVVTTIEREVFGAKEKPKPDDQSAAPPQAVSATPDASETKEKVRVEAEPAATTGPRVDPDPDPTKRDAS